VQPRRAVGRLGRRGGGTGPRSTAGSPDPDMYMDVVEEDGIGYVDPELDAEYEAARQAVKQAREESARLQVPTGWDA
jgi:hypothetical protein